MKLDELARAVKASGKPADCWSLLIYGSPKIGKTQLAATIAKVPDIKNVYWFDIENGSETLITMVREKLLTEEHAAKIILYKIPDTKESPMAMETILKCLTVRADHIVCEAHGKINCVACATKDANGKVSSFNGTLFNITKCTKDDVVVIDSANALGISILNYYLLGKSVDYKIGWDEYGPQGLVLTDVLLTVQGARRTNYILTTHELTITTVENDKEVDRYYPVIGTKNFSLQCGKYFTHIAYLQKKLGRHVGGTGSTYRQDVLTGSRGGWMLEEQKYLDLSVLFAQLKGPITNASTKPVNFIEALKAHIKNT